MRLLFCCQFYAPSIGGVQEVMRELAEQLTLRGHQVTVATSQEHDRDFQSLNGVAIEAFSVAGNGVSGMVGEVSRYQQYVIDGGFDAVMIMAAQQWTFDALWPVLDQIKSRKFFIPCGYSGFYESAYSGYFKQLPSVLRKLDHLVFHATNYRDINFARTCGLKNFSVIPVGASRSAFNVEADPMFRSIHGIREESFVFLTVGTFTGIKGHLELARAFSLLKLKKNEHATLILNGNQVKDSSHGILGTYRKIVHLIKTQGLSYLFKKARGIIWSGDDSLLEMAKKINRSQAQKTVLLTDFSRKDLTQLFMTADLFVFASKIEYSPLVLFEAAAAGTPFLSVGVGNAPEIAQWTGAGVMCPSIVDNKGYTKVSENDLAAAMADLMRKPDRLEALGRAGRKNWIEKFNWEEIAVHYEQLLTETITAQQERMVVVETSV
ncbi:MAG: glycosyltransferase family 4 protein [Burkholderiales bacterium]|nr:glycosyltransferase family 4 protein [Burkholderiales bacterium]